MKEQLLQVKGEKGRCSDIAEDFISLCAMINQQKIIMSIVYLNNSTNEPN
jgi:hypothetical protein